MKNITIFTVFMMLVSIIKSYEKDYKELEKEHNNCYTIKPPTQTGAIIDTNSFVVPNWAKLLKN